MNALLSLTRYMVKYSPVMAVMFTTFFSLLMASIIHFRKRICVKNMEILLPKDSIRHQKSYLKGLSRMLGKNMISLLKSPHESLLLETMHISIQGRQYLPSSPQSKSFIIISAHIGCFDLLPVVMGSLGFHGGFVTKEFRNTGLQSFWHSHYTRITDNLPISKKHASPLILKLLKQHKTIGFMMDQNMNTDHGVFVPFGNKHACTLKAPALLSRKYKIDVIPVYLVWQNDLNLTLIIEPPISPSLHLPQKESIETDTTKYNLSILNMIRQYPHQWIWMHRRFKNQVDSKNPYL